jgi:hypothetical protein
MNVKKLAAGIGVTSALVVGTLGLTAGTASAADNYWLHRIIAPTPESAYNGCEHEAWYDNGPGNRDGSLGYYYYCSQGPDVVVGQNLYHSWDLWERIG